MGFDFEFVGVFFQLLYFTFARRKVQVNTLIVFTLYFNSLYFNSQAHFLPRYS